ncbi:hypothetical protein GW915_07605 [bacterium]|nr:hypothetical protein [bacterium]
MSYALRLTLVVNLILCSHLHAQDTHNGNSAASMVGNVAQFGLGAADLTRNVPACSSGSTTNCILAAVDVLSMVGALMSLGGNSESNAATDTAAVPALPGLGDAGGGGGLGGVPGLGGINTALNNLCTTTPSVCSSCADKPDDPTCRKLVIPDALTKGINDFVKNYDPDQIDSLPLPEVLKEKGALEDALGKIADLPSALASANSRLSDIQDGLIDESSGLRKEDLAIDDENEVVSKPLLAKLGNLPDLSDLLSKFKKQNGEISEVKFVGLDVEDLKTGKRLTLFERAKRRYRGTTDFPRSFTLARMEMMRSRAIAEKQKIERKISRKKAQAIASAKKPPVKH